MTWSNILATAALLTLAALPLAVLYVGRIIIGMFDRLEAPASSMDLSAALGPLDKRVADNSAAIANLVVAVSDGIAHVKRHEVRVAKQVTGARRLLRENGLEHPGLEAEHEELRERDGEGSEQEEVLALPAPVEGDQRPSGIPGLTEEDVTRLKAIGAM